MLVEDRLALKNAIVLEKNAEYGKTIMSICEKYQLFTDEDLLILTDKKCSAELFHSEYAMLKQIPDTSKVDFYIRDNKGRNRYYVETYVFRGKHYVFTSQLYGKGKSHRDNRTPFYQWIMHKLENSDEAVKESVKVDTKETLDFIKEYISAKGFYYTDNLIDNFYLSLKSKPFVILAGISGTGKTRLVKLFAEAIGADYNLVSVRPDWSDGSDLFGHVDLHDQYKIGAEAFCSAFKTACATPDRPVFLCMDEMNLARVEYYFSDLLSIMETREWENDHIVTKRFNVDRKAPDYLKNGIPDNLYIIGTVNMDETTFPFSKKVLDRANTIEFSNVNLEPSFVENVEIPEKINVTNDFLKTKYLVLARDCVDERDFVQSVCEELQEMNKILEKANAHIGYRVRDEIVFYMLNNKNSGNLLSYEQAMDYEIMQKILPRIQGSSAVIKTLLIDMFKFCMGSGMGINEDTGNIGEQMKTNASSATYPKSAEKISYMMTRYEDDGFTSYWL